jgi:hypothetical protein
VLAVWGNSTKGANERIGGVSCKSAGEAVGVTARQLIEAIQRGGAAICSRWWRPFCRPRPACRSGRRRPAHLGRRIPAAVDLDQLILPSGSRPGPRHEPPVLERLGARSSMVLATLRAAMQFLETTSLVIGPLMVVRRRCLGRRTGVGVLVLEQQPPSATVMRAGMRNASQTRRW